MPINTTIVPISLPKAMARELNTAAKQEAMTRSEYVRYVLRRQLSLVKMNAFREEFSVRARKFGIKKLSDAVSAVREVRDKQ